MAGVSQTIPSYTGGISEQPDYIKNPGQVKDAINVIPDITYGLYKRLGAKRIATNALSPHSGTSTWFHYYRNVEEGSYIGQVDTNGSVKMWRCSDGAASSVSNSCSSYLTDSDPVKNLHFTTVNDTTFINNRNKTCELKDDNSAEATHKYYAYVELRRTENARQYGLDIGGSGESSRSYKTATRISHSFTTGTGSGQRHGPDEERTGNCPHIGMKVHWVRKNHNSYDNYRNDLVFRLTVTGQSGPKSDASVVDSAEDYSCTYQDDLTLLYGGENWPVNETVTCSQGGVTYTITVNSAETYTSKVIGAHSLRDNANWKCGQIRPKPTPFDADTAVSASSILGGIKSMIDDHGPNNISCDVIGNGIYIYSDSVDFTVRVVEDDLMRVMGAETSDVTNLPTQCKHGYIVKVANSSSAEDDYYLKFNGSGNADGPGAWSECPKPSGDGHLADDSDTKIKINPSTMPVALTRTGDNQFTISEFTWTDRFVGDDTTNPQPGFIDQGIEKVIFYRNRLALLSGSKVVLSAPNDLGNFWRDTAIASGPNDGITINSSSKFPSAITNAIETNSGLVLFSQNQQFLLSTDSEVLTTDSAKITPLSTYYNNKLVEPISLGTTLGFLDNSGSNTRFMEMVQVQQQTEPVVFEHSKVVPSMLPKDADIMDVSRDNGVVFIGKSGTDTVFGYRYYTVGQQRLLSSWFKWKFNTSYKYFCVTDDTFYFIDNNSYFQKINLIRSDDDLTITGDGNTWDIHLDNWTSISGGSYNATTNLTTFSSQPAHSGVTAKRVIIDNAGHLVECTQAGSTITVPDDWSSGTLYHGWLYDMEVKLPKLYPTRTVGKTTIGDVNGSLTLHRAKVALGKVGSYESLLTRVGKTSFTDIYESADPNEYEEGDIPYLLEEVRTIPIYERNSNVELTIKSTHPSPATLRSLSWEGDYTSKNYRRV